jgi:magnesium-transporting ATPase (P-type)
MSTHTNRVIKQHNIPFIGTLADAFFTSLPLMSVFNSVSVLIVLYESIKVYLVGEWRWLNLWVFLGAVTVVGCIVLLLTYLFVLKSLWSFRSKQMSGMNEQLESIRREIAELRKEMKK